MQYFKGKNKWYVVFMMIMVIGLLFGCGKQGTPPGTDQPSTPDPNGQNGTGQEEVVFENGFFRPSENFLPQPIKQWVEYSLPVHVVQEKTYEGLRYVLITDGMRPTGGYAVEVQEVVEVEGNIEVRIKYTEPLPGQIVTEAITHPYDIIILENNDLPVQFINIDEPDRHVMGLLFIDEIDRPIVATGGWIHIFSPAQGDKVRDTIPLTGLGNVFEGTINYEVIQGTETILSGFTMAAMGDWAYFEENIALPTGISGEIVLEVYSESAKDGSKMFLIEIPLLVE